VNKNRKNHDIDFIPIINNDNRYSASNALNIGIDASKSEYLIFAHQDVRLLDNWFDKVDEIHYTTTVSIHFSRTQFENIFSIFGERPSQFRWSIDAFKTVYEST
jgi:glycosyltransferase involved in cell wall biosynthesis